MMSSEKGASRREGHVQAAFAIGGSHCWESNGMAIGYSRPFSICILHAMAYGNVLCLPKNCIV